MTEPWFHYNWHALTTMRTRNYLCGWNMPSVSCHLHTAVHYQWFHQQSAIPTHVRPPNFQISGWSQSLFLLPQRGGSESRPTTQPKSSDGEFRAGIGAICWAPISWCWYTRMLLPFCPVALEEGSSIWSVWEWSCDMMIHSEGCSSCLCATGLCENGMDKQTLLAFLRLMSFFTTSTITSTRIQEPTIVWRDGTTA